MYKIWLQITLVLAFAAFTAMTNEARSKDDDQLNTRAARLYKGVESTAGTLELFSSIYYNNTFVLNSIEEKETHHLTVSLNHFSSMPNGIIGSVITGGTWSLVVTREGNYIGTIFGDVTDGSVEVTEIDYKRPKKLSHAKLRATGGLGLFAGKKRKIISGQLDLTTDINFRKTTGYLDLIF